eukprot:TRINITY_DN10306_c0_g1_i1.p1 TRINITY_DN10306_c0_g1~~TRINITY_DN10306_c0_g1_i1.p1  ORF type:complete len:84 (-),score=19.57 TRINITY_DN10306_c0_g1_i1:134-385(-)
MENKFDKTSYERIRKMYTDAGYNAPHIVFWNLRGDTTDSPVTSTQRGVSLVSGFSVQLFNMFLDGDFDTPTPEGTTKKANRKI